MDRLDPAIVPQMFVDHDVQPMTGATYIYGNEPGKCRACLVGIEAISRLGFDCASLGYVTPWDVLAEASGWSDTYVDGLSDGWENMDSCEDPPHPSDQSEYAVGFRDGTAAYKAVLEAGLFRD